MNTVAAFVGDSPYLSGWPANVYHDIDLQYATNNALFNSTADAWTKKYALALTPEFRERERLLNERERRVTERERLASGRERLVHERECQWHPVPVYQP